MSQTTTPTAAQQAGIYFPTQSAISNHGFTNVWTGPAQEGLTSEGVSNAGPRPVVSSVKNFADGSRSLVGPYRMNFALPSNWPKNGWRPVYSNMPNAQGKRSTAVANWNPYTSSSTMTAAYLDRLLDLGYVTFFLDGDLGNAGAASGRPWAAGWYAHPAKGVWPADMQNFIYGMQKLGKTVSQNAQAAGASVPVSAPPTQTIVQPAGGASVAVAVPVAVKPRFTTVEKVAAVAVVAAVLYEVL